MTRPTYCLDLDDVVADTMGGLIRYLNERLGTHVTREQCVSRAMLHRVFGLDDERTFKRDYTRPYRRETKYRDVGLIEGAAEGVHALAEHGEIVFLTAREPEILEATPGWLCQHLPQVTRYSLQSANAAGTHGYSDRLSKLQVVRKLGAACLIDDNTAEFEQWPRHEDAPLAVCFAQSWNETFRSESPNVFRGSWPEIMVRLCR